MSKEKPNELCPDIPRQFHNEFYIEFRGWAANEQGQRRDQMNSKEHPERFPPPLGLTITVDGITRPVMKSGYFECGELAQLRGKWVVCTRRKGHPVLLDYGHSNGYTEWCFDSEEETK